MRSCALHFHAKDVYLVMGGHGRVGVSVDGHKLRTIAVEGIDRLYTVVTPAPAAGRAASPQLHARRLGLLVYFG